VVDISALQAEEMVALVVAVVVVVLVGRPLVLVALERFYFFTRRIKWLNTQ
jgi:hypothetical protein